MTLLAIDTSASLCAAAVFDSERELGREVIDIGKGHAEHLMAVIETTLKKSGIAYADLSRIGVAIGPGCFTGIRVGVATARGLALARQIPAVGVNNLEAVATEVRTSRNGRRIMVVFSSSLGALQGAVYDASGEVVFDPAILTDEQALALAVEHNAVVAGSAAAHLQSLHSALDIDNAAVTADIATYARLAAQKPSGERPRPLYLREPDAKPQTRNLIARAS